MSNKDDVKPGPKPNYGNIMKEIKKSTIINPSMSATIKGTVIRIEKGCLDEMGVDEKAFAAFTKLCELTINESPNQQTIVLLKSMIASDHFEWKTMLTVMKAIHFKGRWENKFAPVETNNIRFHMGKNITKNVPTICIRRELRVEILSDLRATRIEIRYQSRNISIIIIVPEKKDELDKISENPENAIGSRDLNQGCFTETRLLLPQINIKSAPNVGAALEEYQMANILEKKLDFSGIFKTLISDNENLKERLVAIGVQEKEKEKEKEEEEKEESGTANQNPQHPEYRVDHPFYYQVVSSTLNVPLFAGCYPARD